MYIKKKNCIHDYLHKVTRYLADYCKENKITVVVIGDITNIRKGKNLGKVMNQKLHSLPYRKIYELSAYKLALYGIRLEKQEEAYSSQCSPHAPEINRTYARKQNRKYRGFYIDEKNVYHADIVGTYNILRKYFVISGLKRELPLSWLSKVEVIKAAV